jgi:hypothetical protein
MKETSLFAIECQKQQLFSAKKCPLNTLETRLIKESKRGKACLKLVYIPLLMFFGEKWLITIRQ